MIDCCSLINLTEICEKIFYENHLLTSDVIFLLRFSRENYSNSIFCVFKSSNLKSNYFSEFANEGKKPTKCNEVKK